MIVIVVFKKEGKKGYCTRVDEEDERKTREIKGWKVGIG